VLRRPLATVGVLLGLDYLLWLWSLGGSRGAVGMIAGPLLVVLALALIWLALRWAAVALARLGGRSQPRRTPAVRYRDAPVARSVTPRSGASPGHDEPTAASSASSSAQIAA